MHHLSRLPTHLVPLLLLLAACQLDISVGADCPRFRRLQVPVCLRPELIRDESLVTSAGLLGDSPPAACAFLCVRRGDRCRGFQPLMTDTPAVCRLFEFDRCSHESRTANCTDVGSWVFIRDQPGLAPGQLCPEGFGHHRLGSKYRVVPAASWTAGLAACSAEAGQLVKFADGWDKAEVDHMHWIKANANGGQSIFIGGERTSPVATDVWQWTACVDAFKAEVWETGQPNGGASMNKSNVWSAHSAGVDDTWNSGEGIGYALCECVDPFN